MQTVWVFGDAESITQKLPMPNVTQYLTYGGDVYGNDQKPPVVNHYFKDEVQNEGGGI